ncbi:porin [Caballeronia sp. dw_19]|uniref:porin n=1 Tax=Caballeronia sp. dw_19 TaxID=2719791 RepID=UPI001BD31D26|nr:porin [Caballeronia sp. dw_19]
MKRKIILTVAVAWLTSSAHAQSSVTLYGSLDEGVTYNTNAKGSGTALAGPVAVPDFFGLRGSEDLGDHLKAVFALQNGFLSNTGAATIANEAFSHFAWVGLSSPKFGTFTMGRQLDLTTEALRLNSNGSIQYTFYLFHPANLDNIGIMGDSINNSLRYSTPEIGGVTASAIYGLDDTTTQPGHVFSADLSYKNGPFRASAVYSSWRNHAIDVGSKLGYSSFLGRSLAGGAVFTARTQRISGLSALYSIGRKVDLHGMLTQVNLGTDTASGRMRTVEAGADFHTTVANTVNVGGYLSWLTDTRYAEAGVGDMYHLSVRTTIYAQVAWQHANGAGNAAIPLLVPSSSANQTALRIGMHHFF